jgi:hypothetical protein
MTETVVANLVFPCAEDGCANRSTKQVYVTFDRGHLSRLACDEHIEAAEAWLLEHRPKDWL